jgi:Protein of unknown function (DUF2949)
MPDKLNYRKMLNFLRDDLKLSSESLIMAERSVDEDRGPLPMILWQYGLVTIEQLDKIYDWLEKTY